MTDAQNAIPILELFHMQTKEKLTYFVCKYNDHYSIKFPASWLLCCDDSFVCAVDIDGFVLDNSKTALHTYYAKGHIDKDLFDFTRKMEFRIPKSL